ncbi:DUF1772 domain-containing protein [Haliscomenobacter hydrossis]|uniref:DUF1772 domain-containing protein n=1 Tax=Haliscomenobacter hydrossis (strain ATCC 27775 / DSM 1100 / LMG 10767 / O) TaxID=760192 RepID=F4KRI0_HALH1|nr:DUF1772 domain-containing protein [Haliscomenobacter hydrossis]AEE47970.1 Protein of unknown function DUF2266, transmembrane [Haliscomenobacter hydrossis DSM 1100]
MALTLVRLLNIIIAALLAGVSFGIWMGFNPLSLSPSTYVEQQQNMLGGLKVLMISLVFIATLITIVSAFLQKKNKPVFIVLLIAAVFFIACILITRFGNKPIDDVVMTWTADALPDNWTALRDKWWSLHIMRTIAEMIALFLVTWASIRKN